MASETITRNDLTAILNEVLPSGIKPSIQFVDEHASGTIASANGYVNVTINFTAPANSVYLGTMIRTVEATTSVNNVIVLAPITDSNSTSVYRVVSTTAQTVTIYARKLYLVAT